MVFVILFSITSIKTNYKNLVEESYYIEKEYNKALSKYKKIAKFILKNKLPENMTYFNSTSSVAYNLSPIKEFKIYEYKNAITNNIGNKTLSNSTNDIIECYNSKCIRMLINKKELLNKLSKSEQWRYNEITTIPIKKTILLKLTFGLFLADHKNFLIAMLAYFFVLYLFQSLFLFIKNIRLTKNYAPLLTALDKNKQELIKQAAEYNKLYGGTLIIQELANEYFAHYVHLLITRDTYIEEINLIDILSRIEKFFSHQITKRNLKITLDCEDNTNIITSDNEIVFIILSNLIYEAIYRSKISAELFIKVSWLQNAINVEITDNGYEYKPRLNGKIQMHELPEPILEKLCQKAKMTIEKTRKNDANVTSLKIGYHKTEEIKETSEYDYNDNTIKIRLNLL